MCIFDEIASLVLCSNVPVLVTVLENNDLRLQKRLRGNVKQFKSVYNDIEIVLYHIFTRISKTFNKNYRMPIILFKSSWLQNSLSYLWKWSLRTISFNVRLYDRVNCNSQFVRFHSSNCCPLIPLWIIFQNCVLIPIVTLTKSTLKSISFTNQKIRRKHFSYQFHRQHYLL